MKCNNCGGDGVRLVFIKRTSDAAEAGKFFAGILTSVATLGLGMFYWADKLNSRWGNKRHCDYCGYEEWDERSWLWSERR